VLGTLIGVLPGLGPVATIAMLLPSIYALDATPALIMLAGIYYGAQYGGSTTAILINVPGESASVVTAIDGYQMARKGRAGPRWPRPAWARSSPAAWARSSSRLRAAADRTGLQVRPGRVLQPDGAGPDRRRGAGLGLAGQGHRDDHPGPAAGQINTDVISGVPRYSFDIPELTDGIGFVAIAMGVFGFGEIIANLGRPAEHREVFTKDVKGLWPTAQDFKDAWPAVLRGTSWARPGRAARRRRAAGLVCGLHAGEEDARPGRRGALRQGQHPRRGRPRGANNAGAQTSFIPMLTLGIPPNAVMALMVGAMTIKGIQPGPQVMTSNPELFWGLIASMWVGNLMLVVLNLPLIGIWIKLLTVPYRFLFPAIMVFCCIGLYTLNNNNFDVYMAALFAHRRLRLLQAGLRAGAAAAGLHPRADDGREPAPRAAAVARRLDHLHDPAAVGRAADGRGPDDRRGDAAVDQAASAKRRSRKGLIEHPPQPRPRRGACPHRPALRCAAPPTLKEPVFRGCGWPGWRPT
jgi:putative tricarboxylic transport membrane protein